MNLLLIIVLIILAGSMWWGYYRGFIRMMFSLLSIVISIAFVSYTTPYVCTYIEENTTISSTIQKSCLEHMKQTADDRIAQQANETGKGIDYSALTAEGIQLPDNIWTSVVDSGADLASQALEDSGVYEAMAASLAHFIIMGISFFVSLVIIAIILRAISRALDLVARLPLLRGANRFFGMFAGLLKAVLLIWLFFYIVAITCTSSFGLLMLDQINQSMLLTFLYNNNLLLSVLMKLFG